MNQVSPNPYLKTRVMTASREELRMMLYEGAIKFCRQGRDALVKENFESSYESITRAERIVLEMSNSLNAQVDPELISKLSALYIYIYRLLVDANVNHSTHPIDEAIKLLEFEKKTWEMLMNNLVDKPSEPSDGDRLEVSAEHHAKPS